MLKYPTDKELKEWEAQAKGDKSWTLQKGQTKNAILRLIAALREQGRFESKLRKLARSLFPSEEE